MIGAVFKNSFRLSSAPKIKIFKKFQACWPHLKQDNYEPASSEPSMGVYVAPVRDSLLISSKKFFHIPQTRKDYQYFLELIILFLGELPEQGVLVIRKPGAFHRARWMSKVLSLFKIWIFRAPIKLTAEQQKGLAEVVLFTVLVYFRTCFDAPIAVSGPSNDCFFEEFEILCLHQ